MQCMSPESPRDLPWLLASLVQMRKDFLSNPNLCSQLFLLLAMVFSFLPLLALLMHFLLILPSRLNSRSAFGLDRLFLLASLILSWSA